MELLRLSHSSVFPSFSLLTEMRLPLLLLLLNLMILSIPVSLHWLSGAPPHIVRANCNIKFSLSTVLSSHSCISSLADLLSAPYVSAYCDNTLFTGGRRWWRHRRNQSRLHRDDQGEWNYASTGLNYVASCFFAVVTVPDNFWNIFLLFFCWVSDYTTK